SGSGAAVAARFCFGSLGSDTGGSIRNPANLCGIAGIKPTYGLVSRHGVLPLSWSLDHCGPLARTVEDCAIMLQAIAGHDPRDAASAQVPIPDYRAGLSGSIDGLRVGVPRRWLGEGEGVDAEVLQAFEAALGVLKSLGAQVIDVDGTAFAEARAANTIILIAEAYAYHEANLKSRPQDYGAVRDRFREGSLISAADYIQAQRARTAISQQVGEILREVDAIVTPAGARVAASYADYDPETSFRTPSFTNVYNLTGLPAISVPSGFSSAKLPIGLQIAGRAFDETTVLRLAHTYEQATDWHTQAPLLAGS
ncbi:MAG TPA: amidase, partial [Chloroflexota bacterium]|nr:amidase [Chloroflexota bacterium]